jgi:hypothetical protein
MMADMDYFTKYALVFACFAGLLFYLPFLIKLRENPQSDATSITETEAHEIVHGGRPRQDDPDYYFR